jgi:hypothetical protein
MLLKKGQEKANAIEQKALIEAHYGKESTNAIKECIWV